ncbi:MAG: HEAT repeat domain-containing protein [Myxococcota bacterium]
MIRNLLLGAFAAVLGLPVVASAQVENGNVHDRVRGEASPGAEAPTRDELVNAIQTAAPGRLMAMLEYGELVECHACVPLLERNLLENGDADVRRLSAWWLRRRNFAISAIMNRMRVTLESDSDPVRRARAARAIGEFLDPNGLGPLTEAATNDSDDGVRAAAVAALGRLNHPGGNVVIGAALSDASVEVRRAAIDQVIMAHFFREHDALLGALGDSDNEVRMRAARLSGVFELNAAVPALVGLLRGDAVREVRQAAAWALGKIGTAEATAALREAMGTESESLVRDAIEIAMRM